MGVGKGIHDMTLKLECVFRFGWEESIMCKRSQLEEREKIKTWYVEEN